jgi:methyl-branched lipid omega-hydroxylase
MTTVQPDVDSIDLSDLEFWALPLEQRDAAFAALRRDRPFAFFEEPELPFIEKGPGYYAVVRHADVEAVSSQPKLFCSGEGATSIANLPVELNEF